MTEETRTCARIATEYQREWVKGLRAELKAGKPYVFANADTPHELFHFMGIPLVTNQWWSAIISAKQLSSYYFDWMEEQGYHDRLARYSSLPLISQMEGDAERAPWGGLPAPGMLCARQSSDDHQRIFQLWADLTGAPLHLLSAPAVPDPRPEWWVEAREGWEEFYGSDRLDLVEAEMEAMIPDLEAMTGRTFDRDAFAAYLERINRQEAIYDEAAQVVADAPRLPMRISEQIPNVMIPQWHRGSDWAMSHAEAFLDEVKGRVARDEAVCETEKIRMMWIGAGLWFDTGFYTAFEESHGAVFAWSMYLPFAGDGYVRELNGKPMRSLAARISVINEQLHQPPWVNAWMVEQAKKFRIDVALMLVPKHDRFGGYGSFFARNALEEAGVRVVEVHSDMVDRRDWDGEEISARVTAVLDEVLAQKASAE